MAVTSYREKRRSQKVAGKGRPHWIAPEAPRLTPFPGLVPVGTVGALLPAPSLSPSLSVLIAGRYEVRVGRGFDAPTLVELVRTLEQLA